MGREDEDIARALTLRSERRIKLFGAVRWVSTPRHQSRIRKKKPRTEEATLQALGSLSHTHHSLREHIDVEFESIGGLDGIKHALFELVILPLRRPQLFARGKLLGAPKGVLLCGPPGTGKIILAKAIAKESRAVFINVRGSNLMSKWFWNAQKLENARVMVLGATNRPSDLDEAILRRLPQVFEIGKPDRGDREKILKVILRDERVDDNIDFNHIATSLCDGYTGSYLLELSFASKQPIFLEGFLTGGEEWESTLLTDAFVTGGPGDGFGYLKEDKGRHE